MAKSKTKKAARESKKPTQKQKASNTQNKHTKNVPKLTSKEKRKEKYRAYRARCAARRLKREQEAQAKEQAIVPGDEQWRNREQFSASNNSTSSDQRMASSNANGNGASRAKQSMREKDQAHASTSEVQTSLSQEHSSVLGHIGRKDVFFSGDDPMAGTPEQEAFHQFEKVRVFLRKRNYANPLVFHLLYETGFSKYDLLSMRGLQHKVVTARLEFRHSNDICRLAQFESLAFAIISASPADWAMLEDRQ